MSLYGLEGAFLMILFSSDNFLPTINTLANMVIAITTVSGLIVAIRGLHSWRAQKKYEFAEEVLTLFKEAETKLYYIRSPYDKVEENKRYYLGKNVISRYEETSEVFSKLFALQYKFVLMFGRGSEQSFLELKEIVKKIIFNAYYIPNLWNKLKEAEDTKKQDIMNKIHKAEIWICHGMEDPDPVDDKFQRLFKDIEKICSHAFI